MLESRQLLEACIAAERERGPVELDCSATTHFGPFGIALIAASMSLRRETGRRTTLRLPSDDEARSFVMEVGLERFATGHKTDEGTVEVREMRALDAVYTHDLTQILARGVDGLTEEDAYPVQLSLNELLQNVFEWSESPVGCTVLARWYKKTHSVRLAVVDRGIGIPAALRRRKVEGLHRASDADVIEAAVSKPQLTSRENRVGGLGLKTIREVVCGRGGSLTVISLRAKLVWSGEKVSRSKSPPLRGTAVEVEFRPDAPFTERGKYVSVF